MALVVADRVQETTSTTGTGAYTLAGAKAGFQSFAAVGDGNTTYYACTDGTDYEVGIGTFTLSGTTLARTTIIESSNSDAAVNWGAGEKDIFVTLPSSKALVKDSGDDFVLADGEKLRFGNGPDLSIYHNGTESIILDEGTGPLRIRTPQFIVSNFGATETQIQTDQNAGVKLFYDNAEKFETVSGGINVTGNITVSGTVDGVDIATNIPSSLGTAGQVLTVNAGATAGEWADVGGGNFTLISTTTISSSVSSVDISLSGSYTTYHLVGESITWSTGTRVNLRVSTDNGSTFKSGSTDYNWAGRARYAGNNGGGSFNIGALNQDDEIELAAAYSTATDSIGFSAILYAHDSSSLRFMLNGVSASSGTNIVAQRIVAGSYNATTAVTDIQLLPESGTFDTGVIKLYGLT